MNLLEDRPLNSGINMKAYTSPDALIAVGSMTLAESDLLDPNDFAELTVNRDDSFELSK